MAAGDAVEAEALDKGRFAGARRTGYADADAVAGVRQYRSEQFFGFGAMIGRGSIRRG